MDKNKVRLTGHLMWYTKDNERLLMDMEIQQKCRNIIREYCQSMDIAIIKGIIGDRYIHIHINYNEGLDLEILASSCKLKVAMDLSKEYYQIHNPDRFDLWNPGAKTWNSENVIEEGKDNFFTEHEIRSSNNYFRLVPRKTISLETCHE